MELDILHQILNELKDLKQGQVKLEQGQAETNAKLDNLEARFDNLEANLNDLTQFVHSIHIHQEADFKLLESVSEKVEYLVTISENHEQRLQKLEV